MGKVKLLHLLIFFILAIVGPGTAFAFVPYVCKLGEKPLERLLAENQYVFVARILSLEWKDPFFGVTGAEQIDYASGNIRARFQVLASIKGNISSTGALDQRLFGNPTSFPYLQVATDYLVFTNSVSELPIGCISRVVRVQYNSFNYWKERLTSGEPDSLGHLPLER